MSSLVSNCITILYDNDAYAQVNENTLDSIANQTGDSEGIAQINTGESPAYISGSPSSDVKSIYVANSGSGTVSVIDRNTYEVKNIPVGDSPEYIFGDPYDPYSDAIYVANLDSDEISVINVTTNTVIKNIPVGHIPLHLFGVSDDIYVANYGSTYVSVIDPTTNTVIKNITVGESPLHIFGSPSSVAGSIYIYVANSGSTYVSVIDPTTNTVIKNITVGESPLHIFGDPYDHYSDAIYVANSGSDSISVINDVTNEVVAGVTFERSPFQGGDIICNSASGDDLNAPINRFLYVSSGTKCIAKPNKGFEFSSWGEVLEGNSTRTINATSGSPWASFVDLFGVKLHASEEILTVNRFGNFTANFRTIPPAIPPENLITIIIGAVVGLSIPGIINWLKKIKQTSRLNSYHREMTTLYDDGKLDEHDIGRLDKLNTRIMNAYSEGKINNEQYTNLRSEISTLYEEIYRKRIDLLKGSPNVFKSREVLLGRIKDDIIDAYSKGKISELHYNLLNEKIALMTSKNDTSE